MLAIFPLFPTSFHHVPSFSINFPCTPRGLPRSNPDAGPGNSPSTSATSAARMRRRPKNSRRLEGEQDWLRAFSWWLEVFCIYKSPKVFNDYVLTIYSLKSERESQSQFPRIIGAITVYFKAKAIKAEKWSDFDRQLRKTAAKKAMQSMGIGNSKASSSTDAPPTITNIYRSLATAAATATVCCLRRVGACWNHHFGWLSVTKVTSWSKLVWLSSPRATGMLLAETWWSVPVIWATYDLPSTKLKLGSTCTCKHYVKKGCLNQLIVTTD